MTISLFACIKIAGTIHINGYHVDDCDFNFVIGSGMPKYEIALPDGNDTLVIVHDQLISLVNGEATVVTLDGTCEMQFMVHTALSEDLVRDMA